MSKSDRGRVFGVDLGKSGNGLARIDYENKDITFLSSRPFKAPEDRAGKSLAKVRREARSIRRQLDRKSTRKKHIIKVLKQFGIIGQECDSRWFETKKNGNGGVDLPIIILRSQGLDRKLTNREWARVLYWFCSQRGYINRGEEALSNEEASVEDSSESDETGKVLSAISDNRKALKKSGYRTFGEYLFKESYATTRSYRNKNGEYRHCVSHPMVVDEINELFKHQQRLGNTYTSEEFREAYLRQLNWLKDTMAFDKLTYQKVGYCVYFDQYSDEPQKRAANADLISEVVKAYEKLGNIRLKFDDKSEQNLTKEVRDAVINEMFSIHQGSRVKSITYKTLRKLIDNENLIEFKGIKSDLEKSSVFVPKAWNFYCRALSISKSGLQLLNRMKSDFKFANAISESLTYATSLESLESRILMYQDKENLEISEEELTLIESLPYNSKIFKGYGSRSIDALEMLYDQFTEGEAFTLDEAEKQSGLQGFRLRDKGIKQRLLPPYSDYDPQCTNPVVLRSLSQARKMINSGIKQFGMPDIIRVELAKELTKSPKQREKIAKEQNKNRKENERIRKEISKALEIDSSCVTKKQILKKKLYEEQKGLDVYTGENLRPSLNADDFTYLKDDSYCQIDHILPYSRSADDSIANKVLVLAKSNQDKGNRTPYEWMTSGHGHHLSWEEFAIQVSTDLSISDSKKWRLLEEDFNKKEVQFMNRNLSDTQYMSKAIVAWLSDSLDFPSRYGQKQHVYATNGRITSKLRKEWGLNFGENGIKDRSDKRHHAIDAAVIAACSASMVKEFANSYSRLRETKNATLAEPWEGFADQVREAREWVIPTMYRPNKKNGLLFEDRRYRYAGKTNKHILIGKEGKEKTSGNIRFFDNEKDGKHVKIVGDVAYIRLWLDVNAREGKGEWLIEPVYFADLQSIKDGTYIPKYIATYNATNDEWKPVPDDVLSKNKPLIVHRQDVIKVDSSFFRVNSVDIAKKTLKLTPVFYDSKNSDPELMITRKWDKSTKIELVYEDALGMIWFNFLKNQNSSES